MTFPLMLTMVVVVVMAAVFVLLREQGPNPVLVLVGRYTAFPFLLVALAPAAILAAWISPGWTLLAFAAVAWVIGAVAFIRGWKLVTLRNAVRRIRIRAMWPSVARSCGLGVRNDRRSTRWPGGVSSTITGAETIEHLPRIWRGRAMANGAGVVYRLRPAKGATIGNVQEVTTNLSAALGVRRIVIERSGRPNRGALKVLYVDALTGGND